MRQSRNINIIVDAGGNRLVLINDILFKGKVEETKKEKHDKDAKHGWYRYDVRFAIPVYENDVFEYELGLEPKLVHKPAIKDRGEMLLVYAFWKAKNGGYGFEVMSKEDIDNHAKRFSQSFASSFSPWKTNYEEMAKKTVIKKCLKYAPLKSDFVLQLSNDESVKSELSVDMSEVVNEQEPIDADYQEVSQEAPDDTGTAEAVNNQGTAE